MGSTDRDIAVTVGLDRWQASDGETKDLLRMAYEAGVVFGATNALDDGDIEDAYQAGTGDGWDAGFDEGFKAGRAQGYRDGLEDAGLTTDIKTPAAKPTND